MALVDPPLSELDPEIAKLIAAENKREHDTLRLIASENYASRAVMEATGSCLTNKYSEGYPHKRYYEGQQVIDQVEELAKTRVERLFSQKPGAPVAAGDLHVNVQPYSGSHPATSPDEDRRSQLARGTELRRRGVGHITVAP